jgi:lipid II:glycine glycyltransferase (peptidoglycan interpeptide bridge formation enzyme)
MNSVEIIDINKLSEWDTFVAAHPLGTIYHTSQWRKVIQDAYGHEPFYLAIRDGERKICAGLPLFLIKGITGGKRLSCLPCAQDCNPLVEDRQHYKALLDFLTHLMAKHKAFFCELKLSEKFPLADSIAQNVMTGYVTYELDIDRPLDDVLASFHKSCIQKPIKRAGGSGLELAIGNSTTGLKQFYQLYLQMRKQKGLLPQPYLFFESLWNSLKAEGMVDIMHARFHGQIVSSILLIKYKDTVVYEYGATLPDKSSLHSMHFLLWEAIKRSVAEGYKIFDFGRTSSDQAGLALFKSRWGTQATNLYYVHIPDVSDLAKLRQTSIMKKLMEIVIKSMPEAVCHQMGKRLYRYLV